VNEVQGDPDAADQIGEVIRWLESEEERPSAGLAVWRSQLLTRRGSFDEAAEVLILPDTLWHGYARGIVLEARCDLIAERHAWDEAREVLETSREHAEEAGLLALPCFADRLEGLAVHAADDRVRAQELLSNALRGFTDLEAAWEAARTQLMLAEVHADAGNTESARELVSRAQPVLEGLRSARELARAEDLTERLG
jgi:hypothetical protein